MKLTFLGTRGEVEHRSRRHAMHSALEVSYGGRRVMVDCGQDWRGRVAGLSPRAIVLTHAHPDHAWGLADGAPCPVYATQATWECIDGYPVEDRRTVEPRREITVEGITFEAFPVAHSTRCPAVGYRITAGRAAVFYAPDVVYVDDRSAAMGGCGLYVGDGATSARSMVRKRGDRLIGHSPMRTQLTWCQKEGVPRAWFTHCGSETVAGDEDAVAERLARWGDERGVEAGIAWDGLELTLR